MNHARFRTPGTEAHRSRRTRWRATARFRRLLFALAVLWVIGTYASGFIRIAQEKGRVEELSAQVAATEKRIADLRAQIEVRRSDTYIEKVARKQLGLVKPGEIRYQFVLPADPADRYYVPEREGDPPNPNGGY